MLQPSMSPGNHRCHRATIDVTGQPSMSPGNHRCHRATIDVTGQPSMSPGNRRCHRATIDVTRQSSMSPGNHRCHRATIFLIILYMQHKYYTDTLLYVFSCDYNCPSIGSSRYHVDTLCISASLFAKSHSCISVH